jgi:hypothetical protein
MLAQFRPYIYGAVATFVALLAFAAWHYQQEALRLAVQIDTMDELARQAIKRQAAADAKMRADASAETDAIKAEHAKRIAVLTAKLKEKHHVSPLANSRCIVPVSFVRAHDDYAAGAGANIPAAADQSGDADSGIPLDNLVAAIADNYTEARLCAAEAWAWRVWYQKQLNLFVQEQTR